MELQPDSWWKLSNKFDGSQFDKRCSSHPRDYYQNNGYAKARVIKQMFEE